MQCLPQSEVFLCNLKSFVQPLKQVFGGWQTASPHKEASGPHNHASPPPAQPPIKHLSKTTYCTTMEKSHRAEKATSFGWFECVTDIILATSNAFCYHCYMPCRCVINGWSCSVTFNRCTTSLSKGDCRRSKEWLEQQAVTHRSARSQLSEN